MRVPRVMHRQHGSRVCRHRSQHHSSCLRGYAVTSAKLVSDASTQLFSIMPSSGSGGSADDLDVFTDNGTPSASSAFIGNAHKPRPRLCRGCRPYRWQLCGVTRSFFSLARRTAFAAAVSPAGAFAAFGNRGCKCDLERHITQQACISLSKPLRQSVRFRYPLRG